MARGPAYPIIGLPIAIQKAREMYEQDGTAQVAPDVIVKAWGYTSLNGTSLRILAALKYYGLTEYVGGDVKLSGRALAILLEPDDSPEHHQAILDAAGEPEIFVTLKTEFPERLPSDSAMTSFLIRKKEFKDQPAQKTVVAFRETVKLAEQFKSRQISSRKEKSDGKDEGDARKSKRHSPPPPGNQEGVMEFVWPLSGDAVATLTVSKELDAEDIETLSDYFKIAKRALDKAAKRPDVVSSAPDGPEE